MRRTLTYLLFSLTIVALAQDKLNLTDIYELEYVSDPQISPDGSRILYVRNFKDVITDKNLSNIWIVDFDGSNNQPVTTGNQVDNNPRWVAKDRIIYKSNKDETSQVYHYWLQSRAEQKITNFKNGVSNLALSPDGKTLAFNMFVDQVKGGFIQMPAKPKGADWNAPPKYVDEMLYRGDGQGYYEAGNTHIFTMYLEGGTAKQITDGEKDFGAPQWMPDGNALVFDANLEDPEFDPLNSEVYRIDLLSGEVTALTDRQGPDYNPRVSPDGKKIAYRGYDDRYQGYQLNEIYVMNADGSGSKVLTAKFDRDPTNLQWNDKSDALLFQYVDEGVIKIAKIDLNGKITDLQNQVGGLSIGRPYTAGTFTASGNGRYAFTFSGSDHPADLSSGYQGKSTRITRLNDDLLGHKKPGKVEEIWFESSFDKRKVHGWIVYPPDFDPNQKYPLLLEIHGGPFLSYSPSFAAELQLFASAGYVVFYANPRGSTSYGEEFGNLIHHNYPGQDYDDLMSGVDAVIEKGFIDEENLFVTGGSGGGVLTAWIIGNTDRFKAAVVAKPVINWYSFVLYADNPNYFYKYWFPGVPWENMEHYMKRSPISLVGNVTTPTMLLTGEEDYRTPIAESEQYYAALKLNKVDASMVRIPGASHGIANRPSNLIAKVAAILSWFGEYKTSDAMSADIEDK